MQTQFLIERLGFNVENVKDLGLKGASDEDEIFKEIQTQPERLFEMIRLDILRETVGKYLTGLTEAKLTHFLGRVHYERGQGEFNHRNGSYGRAVVMLH